MRIVQAAAEFRHLSEDEVLAALADSYKDNAIACEVSRLIDDYMDNFREHCEQIGRIPDSVLAANPATAIERVAMELTNQVLRDALKARAH